MNIIKRRCKNFVNIYKDIKTTDNYLIMLVDENLNNQYIYINIKNEDRKEFIDKFEETINKKSINGFEWNYYTLNIHIHYSGNSDIGFKDKFIISFSPDSDAYEFYYLQNNTIKKMLELFKQHFKLEE